MTARQGAHQWKWRRRQRRRTTSMSPKNVKKIKQKMAIVTISPSLSALPGAKNKCTNLLFDFRTRTRNVRKKYIKLSPVSLRLASERVIISLHTIPLSCTLVGCLSVENACLRARVYLLFARCLCLCVRVDGNRERVKNETHINFPNTCEAFRLSPGSVLCVFFSFFCFFFLNKKSSVCLFCFDFN